MCEHRWVKKYDAYGLKSRLLFCWECGMDALVPFEEGERHPFPHEIFDPRNPPEISIPTEE